MLTQSALAEEPPSKRAKLFGDPAGGGNGGKLWRVDPVWEKELLGKVKSGTVTLATLTRKLEEHVEKIDSEQALEYSMANKEGLCETTHLMPIGSHHKFSTVVRHQTCAFQLLASAATGPHAL
jgi:hypothetical protein|tara:strand:- start:1095 stop:1463 length:369 start_codon:yes stop_codon:yes gene_type:complete